MVSATGQGATLHRIESALCAFWAALAQAARVYVRGRGEGRGGWLVKKFGKYQGDDGRKPIDDVDSKIIGLLQDNPQVAIKTIAQKLGLSHTAAASRVRSLFEGNYVKVAVQRDIRTLGYSFTGVIELSTDVGKESCVAAWLGQDDRIISVSIVAGEAQLILFVRAADVDDFLNLKERILLSDVGVTRVISAITLRTLKYRTGLACLQ